MGMSLWVGTSGYRYWPGDIHPPKTSTDEALRRYAQALPAVEMNRTFYQLPRASSIEKWRALTPPGFVFAAKIWRRLTHEKKLLDIDADWTTFLDRLSPLVSDGGVLLMQLPKTFPQNLQPLEHLLSLVPPDIRLAIEFRHDFWFSSPVYRLLERYGVALVGVSAPNVPVVLDVRTAPFSYLRLHGPRAWYKDRYSLEELKPFLDTARLALKQGDVYFFFDNTIGGHAYWNALEVRETLA